MAKRKKRRAKVKVTVEHIYGNKLILVAATVAMARKERWRIRLDGTIEHMETRRFPIRDPNSRKKTPVYMAPKPLEWRACCDEIRQPTLQFPNVYSEHVKTTRHVANLYGIEERKLRAAVRLLKPAMLTAERLGQSAPDYMVGLVRAAGGVALW